MSECSERPFYTKICLMIAVSIDDAMRCGYMIEWVEEMLKPAIHTIEEISCDTEELWVFIVDFLDYMSEESGTIDMPDMDI